MDFLDKLVIPQSPHHIILLKYILVLTMLLLVPFFTALTGSTILSLFYNFKGKREGNKDKVLLSKNLIDLVTYRKAFAFSLGIVPFLSAIFCYAQLLQSAQSGVTVYLFISLIFFVAGLASIYTYKYSFHLSELFNSISTNSRFDLLNESDQSEVKEFNSKTSGLRVKAGKYGLFLLLVSAFFFTAGVSISFDSAIWNSEHSAFAGLFSLNSLTGFIIFIGLSITSAAGLLLFDLYQKKNTNEAGNVNLHKIASRAGKHTGIISMVILPAIVVLRTFVTPVRSLDFSFFMILFGIILISFIIVHIYYAMIKNGGVELSGSVIFLLIILFALLIINDNNKLDRSGKAQFAALEVNYAKYKEDVESELGVKKAAVSGADIYNGRCIACHSFDKKVVGPPYDSVLPKYEGKMDELVKFILNPVKKNPDYPAMPNQGLKPAEAKAAAEYIMSTYKKQ